MQDVSLGYEGYESQVVKRCGHTPCTCDAKNVLAAHDFPVFRRCGAATMRSLQADSFVDTGAVGLAHGGLNDTAIAVKADPCMLPGMPARLHLNRVVKFHT